MGICSSLRKNILCFFYSHRCFPTPREYNCIWKSCIPCIPPSNGNFYWGELWFTSRLGHQNAMGTQHTNSSSTSWMGQFRVQEWTKTKFLVDSIPILGCWNLPGNLSQTWTAFGTYPNLGTNPHDGDICKKSFLRCWSFNTNMLHAKIQCFSPNPYFSD